MADAKIVLSAVDQTKAAFDSVRSNLQGVQTSATSLKGVLAGLGVTGLVAAFVGTVRGAIEAADQMNKLSQRTGVATEALSQLQFAAKLSDVSADSLTSALKKLNVSIAEALGGDKTKLEAFKNLGVSLRDAGGNAITADQALTKIATSVSTVKDGAIKTSYAVALLGKSGDEMIPLLNGGGAALDEMREKADRLGLTISAEFARKAEDFNDNLTIVESSGRKLAITLADNVVSGLSKAAKAAADAAEAGGKLAAIWAGLTTLFGGDAAHQANVAVVDATDRVLSLQDALDKAHAAGDASREARLKGLLAQARSEVGNLLGAAKAAEAAAAPGEAPKQTRTLKALDKSTENTAALSYLSQLAKEYANMTGTGTKLAEVLEQLNIKGSKFTGDQRNQAIAIAKSIDQFRALQKEMESQNALLAAQDALAQQDEDAYISLLDALRQANKEQRDQVEVMGLFQRDADRVTYFRKLDADLAKAEAAALQGVTDGAWNQAEALRRMAAAQDNATQAKENYNKLAADKRDQELNPSRGVSDAIRDYRDNLERNGDAAREATSRTLSSMEDSLTSFVSTGKLSFRGLVDTIIAEFARLAIVRPLMGQLFGSGGAGAGGLMGLFGGGGLGGFQAAFSQTAVGASGFGSGLAYGAQDLGLFLHGGGIVGSEATFTRYVHPSVYDHAMKYHTGGIAGDEVPTILKKGEGVFTEGQMAAMGGSAGGRGVHVSYSPTIQIDGTADNARSVVMVNQAVRTSQQQLLDYLRQQGVLRDR